MMVHECHAHNCAKTVPPKMFMCKRHWFMVPKPLRDAIWQTYRPGQEADKRPSLEYLEAASEAVKTVAAKEGVDLKRTMYDVAADAKRRVAGET